MTTDHSSATFSVATSYAGTQAVSSFVPYREINPETTRLLGQARRIASPAQFKVNYKEEIS